MGLGTFALVVSAVFATKANKKRATVSTIYVYSSGFKTVAVNNDRTLFTETHVAGSTKVTLKDGTMGTPHTLYFGAAAGDVLYTTAF